MMPTQSKSFLVQHQAHAHDSLEVDYARDLSRGGLFIATRKPMSPSSTLHVQFAPRKDAQLVCAFCRVTHVTPEGVGAEFVGLDAEAVRLIDAAVA